MKGLTLIETMIYLALLTLFIVITESGGYAIRRGIDEDAFRLDREESGRFLMAKIEWAFAEASVASPAGTSTTLSVHTDDSALDPILIRYDASTKTALMSAGERTEVPLAADGSVDALLFVSDGAMMQAFVTVSGVPFMASHTP